MFESINGFSISLIYFFCEITKVVLGLGLNVFAYDVFVNSLLFIIFLMLFSPDIPIIIIAFNLTNIYKAY